MTEYRNLEPVTAMDCENYPQLPETHDVIVDLYHCARAECIMCSRKSEHNCRKNEPGGCRHDLLNDAIELLQNYEHGVVK